MTMPPAPPLPPDVRAAALRAGAVAGALLGVGVSLLALAVVVVGVLLALGAGVAMLTVMWGPADDIPVDELASGVAVPLAVAGVVGLVLLVLGAVASVLLLRHRVPGPGGVAAAACALTLVGTSVAGLVTTAALWPASQMLGGVAATPGAIALAVVLGLAGAPIGTLVHLWMVRRMRARWLAHQPQPWSPAGPGAAPGA